MRVDPAICSMSHSFAIWLNQQICLIPFGFQITTFNLCFAFSTDFVLAAKLAGQLRKPLLCEGEFTLQVVR
jgi:hypothetical protein